MRTLYIFNQKGLLQGQTRCLPRNVAEEVRKAAKRGLVVSTNPYVGKALKWGVPQEPREAK